MRNIERERLERDREQMYLASVQAECSHLRERNAELRARLETCCRQPAGAVADVERLSLALSASVNGDNGWRAEALKLLGVEWDGDPRDLKRGQSETRVAADEKEPSA